MEEKRFYVYAYYLKSTGEIFHIGKGTGDRMYNKSSHRNQYFKNIIKSHSNDVDVKILIDNLTEEEAWQKEKELIAEYKSKGQCKTNFHEGGCGGYTGKYDDPERSRKLSEFAKTRTGEKNPNFNNSWSEEQLLIASQRTKNLWQNEEWRLRQSNSRKGRKAWNKGLTSDVDPRIPPSPNKGKKLPQETYEKMMDKDCPYLYQVYLNEELIFENISSTKLRNFCRDHLNISRTIIEQVIKGTWIPTFKKHQHLKTLKIIRIDRKCTD